MNFTIIPPWFYIACFLCILLYAIAKILQDKKTKALILFLGYFFEGVVIFVLIFIIQQYLIQAVNAKLVLNIQINPNTEVLSIRNNGAVPIEDINVYPTIYITASPETFTASSTKVFLLGQAISSYKYLKTGQNINLDLDNGTWFLFYDANNKLTHNSENIVQDEVKNLGSPTFFEPYSTTTIASLNNIYYFFRVSFKNSLTKEQQIRYLLITAQEGADWFNIMPTNESGSYPAIQTQLQIKDLIFKQQQLRWNDTDSEYYNTF